MEKDEFNERVESLFEHCRNTLNIKAREYASKSCDRLEQFKLISQIVKCTPYQVIMVLMLKHILALADMAHDPPEHYEESWVERICDSINYLAITSTFLREE